MAKTYKVLYPIIEYTPIARFGTLGDKLKNLINKLKNRSEIEPVICLPFHKSIQKTLINRISKLNKKEINVLNYPTNFFETTIDGIKMYLIDNKEFISSRNTIYDTDDTFRFAFYSTAVLQLLELIEKPDIIHIQDWHLGFLPLLLKLRNISIKVLLTIHDINHQGICNSDILKFAEISYKYFYSGEIEFYNNVNILKAGILYADMINSTSLDSYSMLLESNIFSKGLNGIIKSLKHKFKNINEGIDDTYNPEIDNEIFSKYSHENLYGKLECKTALQKELNMPVHTEIPLMIIPAFNISKYEEKVLNSITSYLIKMEIQIVILGNKLPDFEKAIKKIHYRLNCNVASIEYNDLNLRKLLSSGDLILDTSFNLSNVETLKKALKYGVIPIISQESKDLKIEENCFRIFNFTSEDLINTIKYAINKYYYLEPWNEKIKKIMTYDFSLEKEADEYLALYELMLLK